MRALAPVSAAQAASVGVARRIVDHRRAEPAQALLLRQVDAEADRRGAAQLVEQQAGEATLARQRFATERRAAAVGRRVELAGQREQQARHLEHAALAPAGRLRGRARRARSGRAVWCR